MRWVQARKSFHDTQVIYQFARVRSYGAYLKAEVLGCIEKNDGDIA